MSTSIAMSSAAIAMSSVAAQNAHEAKMAACTVLDNTFNPSGASSQSKQQYAECVQMIYPEYHPFTDKELQLLKCCTIIGLIVWAIVLYRMIRDAYNDLSDIVVIGVFGGAFLGFFSAGLAFLLYAIAIFIIS